MSTATIERDARSPEAILQDFASEVLEMCSGDFEEAENQLRYRMRKERARWFDVAVDFVAAELIRHQRAKIRGQIIGAQAPSKDRGLRSLKDEWDMHHKQYMNWPLSCGKSLAKAAKSDVLAEAAFYGSQGRTMLVRRDWFRSVAERMGNAATVGEALDAKTIFDLHQAAEAAWTE